MFSIPFWDEKDGKMLFISPRTGILALNKHILLNGIKREHQGNSTHLIPFQQLHIHEGHTALNEALLWLQAEFCYSKFCAPEFAVRMLPLVLGAGISRRYHRMRRRRWSEEKAEKRMCASNVVFGSGWVGRRWVSWARLTRTLSHLLVLHLSVNYYKYILKIFFFWPLRVMGWKCNPFWHLK